MPYTEHQLRCLNGMGLVPWIKRGSVPPAAIAQTNSVPEQIESQPESHPVTNTPVSALESVKSDAVKPDTAQSAKNQTSPNNLQLESMPLLAIAFRGKMVEQLGNPDAALLVLVEAVSTVQKQYPFEAADAKLFDDMLRAIAWRRQDICLAVVPPGSISTATSASLVMSTQSSLCVADLVKAHRDAVLVFCNDMPETENTDELRLSMQREHMPVWQLPHPALLRESPARKRQAWNVLKAARACLA